MERKYKLTIPEPCTESWDKMTAKDNGRFCLSCSKTVVDFTSMLPNEVQHFFSQNQNRNICGRFKNSQLDSITIQIPSQVLYSQIHYHKIFLLALFIAMGATLFSCQDKDGNRKQIASIEVVDNTEQNQDESEAPSVCYGHQFESKRVKHVEEPPHRFFTTGVIMMEKEPLRYDIIYNSTDVDVSPVPENGMEKFLAFFKEKYVIPKTTEEFRGRGFILFVIEKDGTLSNFNIVKNTPKEMGEEAIRVLKTAPNWLPGKLNTKTVRSSYVLPITIK